MGTIRSFQALGMCLGALCTRERFFESTEKKDTNNQTWPPKGILVL